MQWHKRAEGLGNPRHSAVERISEIIRASGLPLSRQCCIYKVPSNIYHRNVAAYEPCVVSIGPFHHGKSNLRAMQEHKFRYLKCFLDRAKLDLLDLVNSIEEWEEETRACYAENIELSGEDFAMMILVDGVFIIESFLQIYLGALEEAPNWKLIFNPRFHIDIFRDLILLENQLPFFVLERIFKLAFPYSLEKFPTMLDLALEILPNSDPQKKKLDFEVMHLLDLVRNLELPANLRTGPKTRAELRTWPKTLAEFKFLHSATELHGAGVKFKMASSRCLLDIHFKNNILEIPCLEIYDQTESRILNLMVFEQCHYPYDNGIVDYCVFMDYLINTTKDVDLLVQSGVIVNRLGEAAAVATLFNNLCKNIMFGGSNFYFAQLCKDLNAYCRVPWHHWKAIFKRDYFSTPWRTAATIAATMLLVLTIIQTICSIISLRK